jgi:hypothetical protein
MNKPQATGSRVRRLKSELSGGVSIYDGRVALGVVQRHRGDYLAVTPDGRILGSYRTQSAAADALQRRAGNLTKGGR